MEVFCLASGTMISSGLFIIAGLAFGYCRSCRGPVLSHSRACCIPTVFKYVRLTSAMPKAGGTIFISQGASALL